jgi:hypothetical protein
MVLAEKMTFLIVKRFALAFRVAIAEGSLDESIHMNQKGHILKRFSIFTISHVEKSHASVSPEKRDYWRVMSCYGIANCDFVTAAYQMNLIANFGQNLRLRSKDLVWMSLFIVPHFSTPVQPLVLTSLNSFNDLRSAAGIDRIGGSTVLGDGERR